MNNHVQRDAQNNRALLISLYIVNLEQILMTSRKDEKA